ncbi:MAG TPA: metallophosphoesterase family protein [Candidatus Babeliales bacterium]|nr:metallophosphoesterase family protein [Candidatus Babeliales bacterium]
MKRIFKIYLVFISLFTFLLGDISILEAQKRVPKKIVKTNNKRKNKPKKSKKKKKVKKAKKSKKIKKKSKKSKKHKKAAKKKVAHSSKRVAPKKLKSHSRVLVSSTSSTSRKAVFDRFINVDAATFERTVDDAARFLSNAMDQDRYWLGSKPDRNFYQLVHDRQKPFQPYAQRLVIPDNMLFYIWGDIHGHVESVKSALERLHKEGIIDDQLRIIRPNIGFIFLGDYVDRGPDSKGVLNLLLQLKMANPHAPVILLRGNHEAPGINGRYGFSDELQASFPQFWQRLWGKSNALFSMFPVVLYLETAHVPHDILQCSHGLIEFGYDPRALLLGSRDIQYQLLNGVNRGTMYHNLTARYPEIRNDLRDIVRHNDHLKNARDLNEESHGFMWHDVQLNPHISSAYQPGRGWAWSGLLVQRFFDYLSDHQIRIHGVIRGHQHYDNALGNMFNRLLNNAGKVSLHNNMVHTILAANPKIKNEQSKFRSCVKVTTAREYHNWRFEPQIF